MSGPSTALAKRSVDTALMPPPPPAKRIKRPTKVLDEETYTSALSHIIARDFFPGLLETAAQQEFLDALDAGDDEWIDEAGQRVKEAMTPAAARRGNGNMTPRHTNLHAGRTPVGWHGETPRREEKRKVPRSTDIHSEDQEKPDLSLSLAAFQARYTSEDNESFNRVLDRHNAKHATKYAWLWQGNKLPSARQIAQAARQQRLLSSAKTQAEHDRARLGSNRASDSSQALTLRPSNDQDARPASITGIQQPQRNALLFAKGQDDITTLHPDLQTRAEAAAARSNAPPKAVSYDNTRLPQTSTTFSSTDLADDASTSVPESPSLSAIDAAITGRIDPRRYATSTAAPSTASAPGSETPRVNGYAFVDEEPTPAELDALTAAQNKANSKEEDRLAILAAIIDANSPSRDGTHTAGPGPNPFRIAGQPRREALHHRIVEASLARQRATAASTRAPSVQRTPGRLTPAGSPRVVMGADGRLQGGATPMGSRRRVQGELTPAAQRLYERVGRPPGRVLDKEGLGRAFDAEKGAFTPRDGRIGRVRKGV